MYLYSKFPARHLWTAISIAGSAAILISVGVYFDASRTPTFLIEKGAVAADPIWRAAFVLHLVSATLCLAVGPALMALRLIRIKRFHATLGYIYLNLVLWVAAPTGLVISPASKGGVGAAVGFVITGVLWWSSSWFAYRDAQPDPTGKPRNLGGHIRWAIRSYSLALSAVWFRAIQIFNASLFPSLDNDANYVVSVWLSLLAGIVIAEVSILSLPLPASNQSFPFQKSRRDQSVFSKP